jgi:very-short-patch-repair endonuclease
MVDADGRRRYRDAHFEEWGVHVEIDGGQHTEVAAWWADMRRQNAMAVAGDRVLRFPAWAIRNKPDEVITAVRTALIAAGWRPRRS